MMDFWNNHLTDILENLPPNESVDPAERPEMLSPEEQSSREPQYYKPMQKQEINWKRFPPLHATQTPAVYGTVINSGSEKSKSTSTGLLGVDREFGSRLPDENSPGAVEKPTEVETGSSSSFAMSIVIVIGVCLLLVNLCAFAGLYYQRDRLRVQERLMKKRYEDVEPTNNDELYMSQRKDEDNDGEHRALQMTEVRGNIKKKTKQSGDETYEAVRSGGREGRENGMEEDHGGENSFKRWRLSRQCSASTMDPHTKVREWIAHEIVHRCSPRFLRRTKLHIQQQTNRPVLQKDSSFDTSADQLSSAVMTAENFQPNPSFSALSKPTTTTSLQRPRVKKVSVAVDATPAARSPSVLKQIPIEQMSKSLEELGGDRCISTCVEQKKGMLKRSETYRESLARSSLSPDPSHSPQRDTVLRRSITSVNFQVCPPILKNQNNGLNIVHQHSKSDPVHHTTHFMPQTTPEASKSQILIPHIYNISIDSKEGPSSHVYKEGLKMKQMKTFPTSGTHIKFKTNMPKKDVGITASPVSNHCKDINVTSRDSTPNGEEKLPVVDPLKKIQRRNFPRVLPDLPPGPDVLNEHEKQLDDPERELTPVQAVATKRRSLPPPANLLVGLLAAGSVSQPSTPTAAYQKNIQTQTQAGRIPPPPPPRVSSTLGRKPNNTTPVTSLETTQESSKLKDTAFTSSPNHHQRPEPRVIIKPSSTQITHNPSVTQQRRDKRQIPRVTPNTEDYPLTTMSLHQSGVSPSCPSLSRQSSLRSQHGLQQEPATQARVHKAAPKPQPDDSTATPPLPECNVLKNKLRDTNYSLLAAEDTSSNTGTVKRLKKTNQTSAGNQVTNPSVSRRSSASKAWYTQYNQLFLSKSKDSDN
jgi:hypothetical protein